MKKITIFTPTYNRGYILQNLYHSLQRQTSKEFEWLIIDDGSTDDTESIVQDWINKENEFLIRYYKQTNKGKCSAINNALDKACGRLFFTVDSDDYLTDDAVEKIIKWEEELPKNEEYCGLAGNLGTATNKTINKLFENVYFDGTAFDRYKEVNGERAMIFYTDIHRKYKYPVYDNEKFMTEAVAWNRMANDGYKIRYFNDIIWIYEYLDDGLTLKGHQLFINNPKGYGLWLKEKCYFIEKGIYNHFKMYYSYYCDLINNYKPLEIKNYIKMPIYYFVLCFVLNRKKRR